MKRLGLALVFAALALGGLQLRAPAKPVTTRSGPPESAAVAGQAAKIDTQPKMRGFDEAHADLVKKRELVRTLADAEPGAWSRRAAVASVEMSHAQLTGDYDSYVAADVALKEAFAIAHRAIDDENVGPLLLKAQLDYELHRLKPALEALKAPEKQAEYFHDEALLAEITSLRGAITFQLGDYDAGIALLRKSIALKATPAHKQRLAIALMNVGGEEEANAIFDETATATEVPRSLAWIELMRGKMALARGQRSAGRKHLENANKLFPGFWQTEEHLAELDAHEGHTERAIESYEKLVAKTQDPEFMDALAALIADRDPAEAERLRAKSNEIYEARLVKLPEASYGHALEHFLEFEADATRAVEVAKRNLALRPNGEARTRLAQAYVRAGRLTEARAEIMKVTASKWSSAESYATAAIVLRLLGDPSASEMEGKAHAKNPYIVDELHWLKPIART